MSYVPYCRFHWSQERVMIRNRLSSFPISLLLIATISVVPWNASQAAWFQQTPAELTNVAGSESAPAGTTSAPPAGPGTSESSPTPGGAEIPAPAAQEASPEKPAVKGSTSDAAPAEPPSAESSTDAGKTEVAPTAAEATEGAPTTGSEGGQPNTDPNSALPSAESTSNLDLPLEPMVGKKSATGKGLLIAGISTAGLGLALLGTAIGITQCNYDGPLQCEYATQRSLFVPTSLAVTLAGAVLIGAGLGFRARYKKWEQSRDKVLPKKTALVPAFMRGGAGLFYTGEF